MRPNRPRSARGNTSLESAVFLTKSLRWEIQTLGQRLATAANEEALAKRGSSKAKSKAENDLELKIVLQDMKKLLGKLEDAVPLINLAITTSGVSLSTSLPTTVSPSRLLQASTFLTGGDLQYTQSNSKAVQIGPTFTLSLYMLFLGHLRPQNEEDIRETTWKEVMHKARVKLIRVPLDSIYGLPLGDGQRNSGPEMNGTNSSDGYFPSVAADPKADEFAYQLLIIEDLDDDRVHTFEDDEPQPSAFDEVELAGIKEAIPIHEISKIFYADTGKILNMGNDAESNNPVLLLKRDLNAIPPRRMMERYEDETPWENSVEALDYNQPRTNGDHEDSQSQIDAQFDRDIRSSSIPPPASPPRSPRPQKQGPWQIPSNLDPEWLAFEVYTESTNSSLENSPVQSPVQRAAQPLGSSPRAGSINPQVTSALSSLKLGHENAGSSPSTSNHENTQLLAPTRASTMTPTTLPPIRTSLSLLETLIRLLSLQQFQQTSHLSIPDELLNFFLSESATTGAANGDEQERRRLRGEARRRVGFDPYDESPVKRRGEEYQYRGGESQHTGQGEHYDAEYEYDTDSREYSYQDTRDLYAGENFAQREPSYDEGYGTRRMSTPSQRRYPYPPQLRSRNQTPETPPLLLKNRPHGSASSTSRSRDAQTPERAHSMPPLPGSSNARQSSDLGRERYASSQTPSQRGIRFPPRQQVRVRRQADAEKRGSPLARGDEPERREGSLR